MSDSVPNTPLLCAFSQNNKQLKNKKTKTNYHANLEQNNNADNNQLWRHCIRAFDLDKNSYIENIILVKDCMFPLTISRNCRISKFYFPHVIESISFY